MKQKIAVLDVDYTLYNGAIGIDFNTELLKYSQTNHVACQKVSDLDRIYSNNQITRNEFLQKIFAAIGESLKGLDSKFINDACQKMWQEKRTKIFSYVQPFVEILRNKDYRIIILSGSIAETINLIANEFTVKEFYGAEFEVKDGIYTGKFIKAPAFNYEKKAYVEELTKGQNIDWQNSVAIGDSESELLLMEMVGVPIVFQPNVAFRPIAEEKGWQICTNESVVDYLKSRI